MIDSKAIELWQQTNKLLERIAKAMEKHNEIAVAPVAKLVRKGCPIPEHHSSCDCEGAGGWR